MTSWLDVCKFNATSSGTGDFVVSSAVTGYQMPASAGAVNGATYRYRAESADLSQWEVGFGAYTVGSTTLARTTMLFTSTGSKVSFSAAPIVGIVAVAEDMLNIASEAQAEAGTDNTTAMSPQAVSQGILANGLGFKNIAGRNGGMEVWQISASIAVPAANNAYTCDGWYAATAANTACTITRQSGLTSGSSFSCRVQRNSGQTGTAISFGFPLDTDELKKMAGQSVILQFTVSTGANWSPASGTLSYVLFTGTGTPIKQIVGYTGQATPISSSVNLATGAAAATVFSTVAAVAANIGQAEIQFQWTPVGTAGANDWLQIDDVDLRVVPAGLSAAKPAFERSDFTWDFARCLRHYEQSYSYGTAPGTSTQTNANWSRIISANSFLWGVRTAEKRAVPTVTTYSTGGASGKIFDNASSADIPATVDQIGTTSFRVTQSSGTTAAGDGMAFQWASSAVI